jgi:glycerophosphoryl diester phosphodiesterase
MTLKARSIVAAGLSCALLAGCGSDAAPDVSVTPPEGAFLEGQWYPDRRPLNIAHRGGALEFPENTLFAYKQALAAGSHMLEMDLYETADGELVVIHDATVDRTTNGSGSVSSLTLAQLQALDAAHCYVPGAGSDCAHPGGEFPLRGIATGARSAPPGYTAEDFRIPTLRRILEVFPRTLINIELKPDLGSTGSYEGKLAALLEEFGRGDDVIVASFQDWNSAIFKLAAPAVATAVPTGQVALNLLLGLGPLPGLTLGHAAFQVPMALGIPVVTQDFVDDAHRHGLAVHVWTINDCPTMAALLHLGVDGIMTDAPSMLAQLLRQPAGSWRCET